LASVAKQHGHSVEVMLSMYAAWLDGATDADIHAIKQAMEKDPPRAAQLPVNALQFPLCMQRRIARN